MGENESKDGIDYAKELKIQNTIEEAINLAIMQGREEVRIEDGKSIVILRVIMSKEANTYEVFFGNSRLVTVKKDGNDNLSYRDYQLDLSKLEGRFNSENVEVLIQEGRKQNERRLKGQIEKGKESKEVTTKAPQTQEYALQLELDRALKSGHAVEMDIDREFSTTENMRMFINRAFGVSAQRIYRVQGRDPHDFKYIAKTSNSKKPYQEINISSYEEGRNSGQKIWIMEDGVLKEKAVDSLLIRGNYAIATDVPDSVVSGNTQTYLAVRTPKGEYIAIEAGQKRGVNRNTSGDARQKDFMSRENTVYELDDIIEAAQLAERIYGLTKDGKLTTNEVEIVRRLKIEKSMQDHDIVNIINAICLLREMGYKPNEIKRVINDIKDAPDSKEETLKLAEKLEKGDNEKTMHDGHDTSYGRTRRIGQ